MSALLRQFFAGKLRPATKNPAKPTPVPGVPPYSPPGKRSPAPTPVPDVPTMLGRTMK